MPPRAGLLVPLPFRGDLIAAGGVVLAVGLVVLALRMSDAWDAGWIALCCGAGAALLLTLGWRAPVEGPAPRAYVSALLLAAFAPAAGALVALADALGGDVAGAGSLTWVALVPAAGYGALAVARASAACALLAAVSAVVALAAAVDWTTAPATWAPVRWALLAAIVALGAGTWALRERRPRHAQALAVAAGLAAIALAVLGSAADDGISGASFTRSQSAPALAGDAFAADAGGAAIGWELPVLLAGAALLAQALAWRARGMAWTGAAVLAAFAALAVDAGPTLLWWPLLLLVAAAGAIASGLALGRRDLLAGGGIAIAVALVVADVRFAGTWAPGVRSAVCAAGAAAVLALARRARERDDGWPAAGLVVAAFPLVALALLDLADALGGSRTAAGTITWVALALAAGYGAVAAVRESAACTVLAAVAAVVALVAGAQWIFDPETPHGFRWLLMAAIAALAIGVVRLRDRRHPQAVALADAAGLTALALAALLTLLVFFDRVAEVPTGWELLLLATGFGLVAFGAVDRANGPVWIGAAVLLSFAALAALADASVLWWPAFLVALGLGVVAAGLRPTTPAPPPPDADAPPASTTPFQPPEPPQ